MKILIIIFLFITSISKASECNLSPEKGSKNYIVGYGSLMEKDSRTRTNKDAKNVKPLMVKNFERTWGQRSTRYKITFLTIKKKEGAKLNAVYYPLSIKGINK